MAFPASLTVLMVGHKDGSTTGFGRALTTGSNDAVILVYLVVFHNSKFGFLAFMLDFLRSSIVFLLLLFSTTTETENKMKSRLFLNIIISKSAAIF